MTWPSDPTCNCERTITTEDGKIVKLTHVDMPLPLRHLYELPALGAAAVPVYRGALDIDGKRCRGLVWLSMAPIPRITVEAMRTTPASAADLHALLADDEPGWVSRPKVKLVRRKTGVPLQPRTARRARPSDTGKNRVGPLVPGPISVGDGSRMDQVTFFVTNGWSGGYGPPTCHDGRLVNGRLSMTMDEWDVRIEPRGDVLGKELQEHMRTSGEHTVTHVARLRRADATPFSESAALAVLREFDDLLSFGTGRTISCLLPVGWLAGAPVWTHWAALRAVDPPLQVTSWVHDTTAVPQMTALLAAGHNAYRNPLICESFRAALTFYLTANFDAPATMGTLMSVSGMQIVAYAHFVSDPACQSPVKKNDWESLSAVSILRKILKPTLVDMAVPPWLTNLAKRYSDSVISNPKQPPPDALSVVIKLRNSVAHPSTKALGKWTHYDWVEAGFYSMHFFEVLLLWWLGYDGEYRPRTDPSANKTVPWATNFPTGLGKGPANTEP